MRKATEKTIKSTIALRNALKHGDLKTIQEATGYSYVYVCQVLDVNNVRKNSKIIEVAESLVAERQKFVDQYREVG